MQNPRRFEVATTITETNPSSADPPRICISDPRRSTRQLYLRLETWLSRFWWESFREAYPNKTGTPIGGGAKLIESWLIGTDLHYIRHLRRNRLRPCEQCQHWIAQRLRGERGTS